MYSTPSSGACNNPHDQSIITQLTRDHDAFSQDIRQCAEQSLGDVDDTTQCLHDKTQLSDQCSACFGKDVGCMTTHCMNKCFDADQSSGV